MSPQQDPKPQNCFSSFINVRGHLSDTFTFIYGLNRKKIIGCTKSRFQLYIMHITYLSRQDRMTENDAKKFRVNQHNTNQIQEFCSVEDITM